MFSLPVAVFFAFPFFVYLWSGEFVSVFKVLDLQADPAVNVLYDSGFDAATFVPYKTEGVIRHKPEIIALGLSRTLTIRSEFFRQPDLFYNAGSGIRIAPDLDRFMERTRSNQNLKVIVFDASNLLFDTLSDRIEDQATTYDMFHQFFVSGWRTVYAGYASGSFNLNDVVGRQGTSTYYIGLGALRKHDGFRRDGSLSWGDSERISEIVKDIPGQIVDIVANTTLKKEPHFSGLNYQAVERFLANSKERGIYVIGYLSPYATAIYRKEMSLDEGGIYRTEPVILGSLFKKYGYNFYNLKDLATIGSSDGELYDAIHSSQKGILKLLIYLVGREPVLSKYLESSKLKVLMEKETF